MSRQTRSYGKSFRGRFHALGSAEKPKSLKNDGTLKKTGPRETVCEYDLETTDFAQVPPRHHAKKRLLHDLSWLPGAGKVLKWMASRYDSRNVKPSTPECSQDESLDCDAAAYDNRVESGDIEGPDETERLLATPYELDAELKSSRRDSPHAIIANPDAVPPSPSTVHELQAEDVPSIHENMLPVNATQSQTPTQGLSYGIMELCRNKRSQPQSRTSPYTNGACVQPLFNPLRPLTPLNSNTRTNTKQVQLSATSPIPDGLVAPSAQHRVPSPARPQTQPRPAAGTTGTSPLVSPLTAAFAAFNHAPGLSYTTARDNYHAHPSDLVPCRLYVRARHSYADGIISFARGDTLLVTARRGAYLRYEPSPRGEGWFPGAYCEVVGSC